MSKIANLGAGLLGGFIAGRQAKDRKTREEKQDKLYDRILEKMALGGANATQQDGNMYANNDTSNYTGVVQKSADPTKPINSAPVSVDNTPYMTDAQVDAFKTNPQALVTDNNLLTPEQSIRRAQGYAKGGMIQQQHYDRGAAVGSQMCDLPMGCSMAWQRQSFKKK